MSGLLEHAQNGRPSCQQREFIHVTHSRDSDQITQCSQHAASTTVMEHNPPTNTTPTSQQQQRKEPAHTRAAGAFVNSDVKSDSSAGSHFRTVPFT